MQCETVLRFNGNGPVIGIDIDGTLGDYHGHFIRFAEGYTGRTLPDPRDINPAQPFRKFLGLGSATYRECKLAYRQGGMKRSMPCYEGASELTRTLRKLGAEVWICTSRPYLRLGNVDGDTRHWLLRNKIQYDNLLWGENKYRDLSREASGRVVAIMDDLPEMLQQARDNGLLPILRDQPYNKHVEDLIRVMHLYSATEELKFRLAQWKEMNRGR